MDLAVDVHRAAHDRRQPVGQVQRLVLGRHVLAEHHELVAAEPGHGVARAHRLAEPAANLHQELVAGGVAPAVVEPLEAIDVEEEHGEPTGPHLPVRHHLGQPPQEGGPVRQPGEGVVEGLVGEGALHCPPGADVLHGPDEPLRRARPIPGDPNPPVDPASRAIRVDDPMLDGHRLTGRPGFLPGGGHADAVGRVDAGQQGLGRVDGLRGVEVEQPAELARAGRLPGGEVDRVAPQLRRPLGLGQHRRLLGHRPGSPGLAPTRYRSRTRERPGSVS